MVSVYNGLLGILLYIALSFSVGGRYGTLPEQTMARERGKVSELKGNPWPGNRRPAT